MGEKHIIKATVFNIDANDYEEREFEVSDDVYKIITDRIGEHYSIGKLTTEEHDFRHVEPTEADLVWAYNYNAFWDAARGGYRRSMLVTPRKHGRSRAAELLFGSGVERPQAPTDSEDG